MVENLKQLENAATREITYTNFAIVHGVYLGNTIIGIYFYAKILKSEMIKQYSVTFVLHYSTFLYNYLIYIALKLMFVRYKKLSEELFQFFNTAQHRRVNSLSNFLNRNRSTLVDLKETSDLINDVFGWPILLIIFSAYQQILVYLDVVVNNPQNRPLDVVLLNVTTILIVWVKF
jgi:hypothetical protein